MKEQIIKSGIYQGRVVEAKRKVLSSGAEGIYMTISVQGHPLYVTIFTAGRNGREHYRRGRKGSAVRFPGLNEALYLERIYNIELVPDDNDNINSLEGKIVRFDVHIEERKSGHRTFHTASIRNILKPTEVIEL